MMIKSALSLLFILFAQAPAEAKITLAELFGTWKFTGIIHQGQRLPPPNPNLQIRWEFREVGLNRLTYWREGERGLCDREALFWHFEDDNMLYQQVLWTNPENRWDCGSDTDMQIGMESWTHLDLVNNELQAKTLLGEETLILLWERDREAPPERPRDL